MRQTACPGATPCVGTSPKSPRPTETRGGTRRRRRAPDLADQRYDRRRVDAPTETAARADVADEVGLHRARQQGPQPVETRAIADAVGVLRRELPVAADVDLPRGGVHREAVPRRKRFHRPEQGPLAVVAVG